MVIRIVRLILAVIGSADIFSDENIGKEDNAILLSALIRYITSNTPTRLDPIDGEMAECTPQVELPDVASLAERLRGCLQEPDPIPSDFLRMFDTSLYGFSSNHLPDVAKLYKEMEVQLETLKLIPPQFVVPLPPLQPAVFPPALRELPAPSLELFDLDAEFASTELRLAQLANKCDNMQDDLEYFVQEAGEIVGIGEALSGGGLDSKKVLQHLLLAVLTARKPRDL